MRVRYRDRRHRLLERLETAAPGLQTTTTDAGLHVLVRLPSANHEVRVLAAAERRSVGLLGLRADHGVVGDGIVIGYSRVSEHAFAQALDSSRPSSPTSVRESDGQTPSVAFSSRR